MAKIVIFSNKHRANDNRLIELEARPLAASGHEVIVYGNMNGIDINESNFTVKQCATKSRACLNQCLIENGDIYIFQDPGLLSCAVKLQKRGKICLFDSHENYEEKIKTRLANKFPILAPLKNVFAKIWWLYERHSVKKLSGKICADRTVFKKYNANTFLLPNMPSKEFYENLPARTSTRDVFTLIYVGTITWDRGIIETAKAIQLCKHKNVQFQVIGDTKDEKLKEKIQSYPNVIWNGRIEWRRLKKYLVNSDVGTVLLQPTEAYLYCPGENIVKLWEYMSIGLPVLISDFPGLRKLNDELKFGYTVKPDDINDIAKLIDWMIENLNQIKQMGANGRTAVIEKYNAEHYMTGFVKFLESLT